jgi:hypothetical protein
MEMLRAAWAEEPAQVRAAVRPCGHESWRLDLEGVLPVDCVGALARGLANSGLDIVQGRARRTDRRNWRIELELASSQASVDTARLDYVALARLRSAPAPGEPIVLSSYEVVRDAATRALVVSVRGADRVGFLAGLLERFAGLLLFPIELTLATVDGTAVDVFVLRALGDRTPPPDAEAMLVGLLERLKAA